MTPERSTLLWTLLYEMEHEPLTLDSLKSVLIRLIQQDLIEAGEMGK